MNYLPSSITQILLPMNFSMASGPLMETLSYARPDPPLSLLRRNSNPSCLSRCDVVPALRLEVVVTRSMPYPEKGVHCIAIACVCRPPTSCA